MTASISPTTTNAWGRASTAHHGWLGFLIGGHPEVPLSPCTRGGALC